MKSKIRRIINQKLCSALIPIVDFIMKQPRQQLSDGQATLLRQYLYMSFFTRFYSYGADVKLDIIHKYIKEKQALGVFPVDDIGKHMGLEKLWYYLNTTTSYDLDLILNIIQGGVYEIPSKRGWSLERDHIFPRSLLLDSKIAEELIDDIGNLRLINKTRSMYLAHIYQ